MAVVFNCRPNGDKAFGDAVAQALCSFSTDLARGS